MHMNLTTGDVSSDPTAFEKEAIREWILSKYFREFFVPSNDSKKHNIIWKGRKTYHTVYSERGLKKKKSQLSI